MNINNVNYAHTASHLKRVAGYARVSTDLQRDKETIKTQQELIRRFCDDKGFVLTELYCDDGVTGTLPLADRPAGARLLTDAKKGRFDGLVVYKADRIGRDVLVNETVARELYDGLGIEFYGVAEQIDLATPVGRAMFTFQSALGRLERENTLRRSWDATVRLAKEGVWLGGIVPFGYRVEGKNKDARIRISDEIIPGVGISEADIMRLIYRWSGDEGLSCIIIAERLNVLGIPTCYTRDEREVLTAGLPGGVLSGEAELEAGAELEAVPNDMSGPLGALPECEVLEHDEAEHEDELPNGMPRPAWFPKVALAEMEVAASTEPAVNMRNKRKLKTQGVWRAGRVHSVIVEPTFKGTHMWGKRGTKQGDTQGGPIERAVPAIVDEELWARAQVTLQRNRLSRPDVPKRPYLLRGLIRCTNCGLTYVGMVCNGQQADTLTPDELAKLEVGPQGLVKRSFYRCAGRTSPKQLFGQGHRCSSAYVRGNELEDLVWSDVKSFLHDPLLVLKQLDSGMQARMANSAELEQQLQALRDEAGALHEQRANLFRLYRKGSMNEDDLERQLQEISGDEEGLKADIARMESELAKTRGAGETLRQAEILLRRLRVTLDEGRSGESFKEGSDGEVSWATKRRIIEQLVAGIEVSSYLRDEPAPASRAKANPVRAICKFDTTIRIRYRFEEPDLEALRKPAAPVHPASAHGGPEGLFAHGHGLQRLLYLSAGKRPGLSDDMRSLVKGLLEANHLLTLDQLCTQVEQETGTKVSRASMSRLRKVYGFARDHGLCKRPEVQREAKAA
jgi:DNA invertase Pin-like site-specific DNA recombinase